LVAAWPAGLAAATLTLAFAGCRPAPPGAGGTPPAAPRAEEPDAPKGEAIADPGLREAREQADATLGGLLAGKFDKDTDSGLSAVAQKVKGYQSYAVKSQKAVREGAAEFEGVLSGPVGRARFGMLLVKQQSGRWAVGTFSGPYPE
jgi:hypothetical protein